MRVLPTGGTCKAGRHVIAYLPEQGHQVLNIDLALPGQSGADSRIAELTDAGRLFDVMQRHTDLSEPCPGDEVPSKREIRETETFYFDEEAKKLLGFAPQYSWRNRLGMPPKQAI